MLKENNIVRNILPTPKPTQLITLQNIELDEFKPYINKNIHRGETQGVNFNCIKLFFFSHFKKPFSCQNRGANYINA